jgi:hypothetical protein
LFGRAFRARVAEWTVEDAEVVGVTEPTMRILSLGAGVQSTTLALMARDGTLPGLDAAIFADTGWEPPAVYDQVDRLQFELACVNIPVHRISRGNLRSDTTDPTKRFVSVPWFIRNPDGGDGMGRRQCTAEYKLAPINRKVRELLGAKPPKFRAVARGRVAEQWIGFSTDEVHRCNDKPANLYTRQRYPLIELGMSRKDCIRWLDGQGWGHTVKSACIGCPLHGNAMWRDLRDNHPEQWMDAVTFDQAIRKGGQREGKEPLRGEAFLHRSRVPLDEAPIDRWSFAEYQDEYQLDLFEDGDPDGCSPYGCRSGEPVTLDKETT